MKADIVVKSIIYNRKLGRILLVQRCNADDIGAGTWENAGGNVEQGETPEIAEKKIQEIEEKTPDINTLLGNGKPNVVKSKEEDKEKKEKKENKE